MPQLAPRSFRWLFLVCLLTLGVSIGTAGTIMWTLRHADQAMQADAHVSIDQAVQQVENALKTRRETISLLRDALDRAPQLSDPERIAVVKSMVGLTPDLVGCGILEKGNRFRWWVSPFPEGSAELETFTREITRRVWLRNAFRIPSRLSFWFPVDRSWWIVIEPFLTKTNRSDLLIALFDARQLSDQALKDPSFSQLPLRLIGQNRVIHQSASWKLPSRSVFQPLIERRVGVEGVDWTVQIPIRTPHLVPRLWLNVLIVTVLSLAVFVAGVMMWAVERLRWMATTDELTGLFNRRYFVEHWTFEHARALRYRRPLSCLMIDVDRFKQVNDLLGHAAGDRLLKELAGQIKQHLRTTDILARYGGDEFVVALPETHLQQARQVERKLLDLAVHLPHSNRLPGPVTISVGTAEVQLQESAEETLHRADAQLAQAKQDKQAGRTAVFAQKIL